MTDARSPLRALRAALFAAVAVILAAMGHSSLSAHDLPLPSLLGALGVTTAAGWLAAGRRRGAGSIGAGLLAVQAVLHLVLSGGPSPAPRHHHGHPAGPADTADAAAGFADDAAMLAVHLAAAAGCALWIAHGEAAFFRLARTALAFAFTPLRRLVAVWLPLPSRPALRPSHRPRRLHGVVLTHFVVRRGPPGWVVPRATAPGATV
jgi:hypothetical protein